MGGFYFYFERDRISDHRTGPSRNRGRHPIGRNSFKNGHRICCTGNRCVDPRQNDQRLYGYAGNLYFPAQCDAPHRIQETTIITSTAVGLDGHAGCSIAGCRTGHSRDAGQRTKFSAPQSHFVYHLYRDPAHLAGAGAHAALYHQPV